jgi:hypothetical protein
MCWNADISINTFIFACFALVFIFFASFTKYKLESFNPLVYLFIFEVALMQLIEFFLWKNLKNENNYVLTKMAAYLVLLHVPTLMFMITNIQIRNILLFIYGIFVLFLLSMKSFYEQKTFHTTVSKNGHLLWGWVNNHTNLIYIYIFLYAISVLFTNNIELILMVIGTLFVTLFFFFKEHTFTSIWCWSTNLFLLYFIVKILIILPFYEYNGLC